MADSFIHRDLVRRAVEICGDKKTLAALLTVTVDQVTSWAEGRSALPDHLYPLVVKIIFDYERKRLRRWKSTDGD